MKDSFRAIRVKSREEFEWLMEHVTHEAFRVRDDWEFWTALNESFDKYLVEPNQTPNFWGTDAPGTYGCSGSSLGPTVRFSPNCDQFG
jgi:hypothetical protein